MSSRYTYSSKRNVIFLRDSEVHSNLETSEVKSIILLRDVFISKTITPLPLSGRATMIDLFDAKRRTHSRSDFVNMADKTLQGLNS